MHKRGSSDTSTLTLGFIIVGSIIALLFLSAGIRAGRVSFVKNELYAKDLALLTDTILSVSSDTDLVLHYPHDFTDYVLTYDSQQVIVSYQLPKETSRAVYPYMANQDYTLEMLPQSHQVQYIKLGKEVQDHAQKSGS